MELLIMLSEHFYEELSILNQPFIINVFLVLII